MSIPLYLVIGSGLLLFLLFVLFKIEDAKGQRLLMRGMRGQADRFISQRLSSHPAAENSSRASLRLLFHFILHQILGAALYVIKTAENLLDSLRRHNHQVAHRMNSDGDSHLSHMVRHKKAVSLSDTEKAALRERSLND